MVQLRPSGFFVLRTPMLPFDQLVAFGDELESSTATASDLEDAVERDRHVLRKRLAQLVRRADVRDALAVSSPGFHDAVESWLADDPPAADPKLEAALARYFHRMAGRPTPFGLLAGWSTGTIGEHARLTLPGPDRSRPHSRLDMDYLFALVDVLGRGPKLRAGLMYQPNPWIYAASGRLHYVEARVEDERRSYQLVAADATPELLETLERARAGASMTALADALVCEDIHQNEAAAYVEELVDAQLLVPDIALTVHGPEPTRPLARRLRAIGRDGTAAQALERVAAVLERADSGPAGRRADVVRDVARELERLPIPVEMSRLVQVDLCKPLPGASLPVAVVSELVRAVEVLRRLSRPAQPEPLRRFRERFAERYGDMEVPLPEALDAEAGVGFEDESDEPRDDRVSWDNRENALLQMATEAARRGRREVDVGAALDDALVARAVANLPDAFAVMASLAADSEVAIERGDFELRLFGISGPSGARLLGRMCHADAQLRAHVEQHLRAEEALQPDAIFAEIVHLPEGRLGNILARPRLREHEIVLVAGSSAGAGQRIPLSDLMLAIDGEALVLRSRQLGRRVIPRLTTAHTIEAPGLGVYRFLGMLQVEGIAGGMAWDWGPLASLPRLPRVRTGRTLLALERWNLGAEALRRISSGSPSERFAAVQTWRRAQELPRLVAVEQGESALPVDLDNPLSVETMLGAADETAGLVVLEQWPSPDRLAVAGPGGRFVHEIIVPFTLDRSTAPAAAQPGPPSNVPVRRALPPGSEWLYLKLYTGIASVDRVLIDELAPQLEGEPLASIVDRWHFLRFTDPQFHLRLRFHGHPAALRDDALPALLDFAGALVDRGLAWRFSLDTYEREIQRYGGPEGIELAEAVFDADSAGVLAALALLPRGDEAARERWRVAVATSALLMRALGFDDSRAGGLVHGLRDVYAAEHAVGRSGGRELGRRFRAERPRLEPLLAAALAESDDREPAVAAYAERIASVVPIAAELVARAGSGRVSATIEEFAASIVHMHVNRLLRTAPRAHELLIYDALDRLLAGRLARARTTDPAR